MSIEKRLARTPQLAVDTSDIDLDLESLFAVILFLHFFGAKAICSLLLTILCTSVFQPSWLHSSQDSTLRISTQHHHQISTCPMLPSITLPSVTAAARPHSTEQLNLQPTDSPTLQTSTEACRFPRVLTPSQPMEKHPIGIQCLQVECHSMQLEARPMLRVSAADSNREGSLLIRFS